MSVYRNAQFMVGKESTFNTAVTVDTWLPVAGDVTINSAYGEVDSEAIYPGETLDISEMSMRTTESASGSIPFELRASKFGELLAECFGFGVSTLVSGTTYQQQFYADTTGDDSFTMQLLNILDDGTDGDVDTFSGCRVSGFELSMDKGDQLKLSVDVDGAQVTTGTAKGTPTVVHASRFPFSGFTADTGTITVPTDTALGSGTTPLQGVQGFSLKVDKALDTEDYRANLAGKKALQRSADLWDIRLTLTMAHTAQAQALRAAWRSRTAQGVVLSFATPVTLSTGTETFQIVLAAGLVQPTKPNADGTKPMATVELRAGRSSTVRSLYAAMRTADTAL